VTLPCMGEERGRQSGGAAAGGLPADVWSEVGGLSGRLLVEDEEKLFALLVSPLFEEAVTARCYDMQR